MREPEIIKCRVLSLIDGPGEINRRDASGAITRYQKNLTSRGRSRDDARDRIGGLTFIGRPEHCIVIVYVDRVARKIFMADDAQGVLTS